MSNIYVFVAVTLIVMTIALKRKKLESKTCTMMFYSFIGAAIVLLVLHERKTEVNIMQNEFIYHSVKSIIAMMKG